MANGKLARKVCIIGVGYTPLGNTLKSPEVLHWTERELFSYAAIEAMEDAGIKAKDIDAYYVGMSGPNYNSQMKSAAPHFGEWIGMRGKPALFHDEGCGSFAAGLHESVLAVASGAYDCILNGAVQTLYSTADKNKPLHLRRAYSREELYDNTWTDFDPCYEKPGTGGADALDQFMVNYLQTYNISVDTLDDALINYAKYLRKAALLNPKKALNKGVTWEDEAKRFGFDDVNAYLKSPKINPFMGTTLRGKWMSLWVDAGAACIVCAADKVKDLCLQSKPIEVAGIGMTTLSNKGFIDVPVAADKEAFDKAYAMAGITDPGTQIEYMELIDCPIYSAIRFGEASGYIPAGKSCEYMLGGNFEFDGDHPMNASGGKTQLGHPAGASAGISLAETVYQMRGEAGPRQIKKLPKTAVMFGAGGGATDVATVLRAL